MGIETRDHAIETLRFCRVPQGVDFHTLSSDQVSRLVAVADLVNYRKPRNANGSRARYFHAMLERRAARKEA